MLRPPPARTDFQLALWFWLPVLAYVTLILVLAAQPNLQPPIRFTAADKVCHLLEYGGLGLLLARALRAQLRARAPLVAAAMALGLGVLVGATDETVQRFVPGRDASLYDLAADAVGLALAQVAYLAAARR